MPTRSEKELVDAARGCDDCLCWLEQCGAICCGRFTFSLTPFSDVVFAEDEVRIHTPLTPDARNYYELHGARVEEGDIVVVPRAACEVSATLLAVNLWCSALQDDLLCSIHDAGQPTICREFVWETAFDGNHNVPPTCLFEYKRKAIRAI